MPGPRPKPIEEIEDYWNSVEERIEAQEFGPLPVAEERCDRDIDAMLREEDLGLYEETGRVY